MSVYTGWQTDLLSAGPFPDTKENRDFLTAWHQHADSNCNLNPVDLTAKNSGSRNCKATGFPNRSYQIYSDKVWTRTAWHAQITTARYDNLRAALESGAPYHVTDYPPVVNDLGEWGSFTFANVYLTEMMQGGIPSTLPAARLHNGYRDLQHSVNRRFPAALNSAHRNIDAGLRSLARARKVHL